MHRLAICHAPCAPRPPDLRVRGFVVVEEVERFEGALLVVDVGVLDAVELHPDGHLAVLVTQVHVHDDGVYEQTDVVGAVPELHKQSLITLYTSFVSKIYLVGVIKLEAVFSNLLLVTFTKVLQMSHPVCLLLVNDL